MTAIVHLLQPAGVTFTRTETSCLDRAVQAEAEAERATEKRRRAEDDAARLAEEIEEQKAALAAEEAERRQAQEIADATNAALADLERRHKEAVRTGAENAESLEAEVEEARRNRDTARQRVEGLEGEVQAIERVIEGLEAKLEKGRQDLVITIVTAVAAVLLLTVVGGVFYRRRSLELARARQQAVAGQRKEHGDGARRRETSGADGLAYLLTGETGDGNAVSLKVLGSMVASGVVIGRSPRNALLLIDDKTLSREHAKLFEGRDGVLNVEDLGTTNGTRVNGRQLKPGRGEPLQSGDTLQLGEVTLRLTRNG